MVGPDHDTPDDSPDEGGTAPADLLQMWISGRNASAAAPPSPSESPEPATETAPDADTEPVPESVTDAGPDTSTETSTDTEQDSEAAAEPAGADSEPAPASTLVSAPVGRAPSSSAPWASTPPPVTYGRTAAETAGSGSASGSGWWPYAETDSPAPDPVDPPAAVAEAGADGLHEDVESEWTSTDATAVPEATDLTETPAPVETAAPVATGERPHWASFGEAQTAEEVLDRLGPGASLPGAPASRPAAAAVPQPEPGNASEPIGTPTDPETDSETDLSATTHWSLDDFEAYIRAQSNNELDSWMGSQATSSSSVAETPIDEAPVDEAPIDEAPIEEAPVEEPPVADTSADVAPVAEAPVEEAVAEEEAPVTGAPVDEPAAEETTAAEPAPAPAPASTWTPTIVHSVGQSNAAAAADVPVVTDDSDDSADDGWAQPDVEWDHAGTPAGTATPGDGAGDDVVETPAETGATDPEATQYADFLREDEAPGAPGPLTAAALEADPDSGTGPLSAAALEAGAETPTEAPTEAPTETPIETPTDVAAPALVDAPDEEVAPAPIVEPEPEPISILEPAEAVTAPDSELIQAEHHPDPEADDYQEWHDDQGLRWVSHDGGYTWYSDDGQGWNAEIGEAIDVPAGYRPATVLAAPSEGDATPAPTAATADDVTDTTDTTDTTDPVDPVDTVNTGDEDDAFAHEPEPWPEEPVAPAVSGAQADEVWPSTSSGTIPAVQDLDPGPPTQSMWPGEAPQAFPPTEAIPTPVTAAAPEPALTTTPDPAPDLTQSPVSSAPPASADTSAFVAPSGSDASTPSQPVAGADQIPPFVEYKPRGAYRPLLGVLFVAAALLAVVAIFWAVTQGSQAATGIAVGVTGFALAFWWGLLSWTPTIVSVSGSILEVARGSDGERFDLRSSKLMIDVDDDTGSRNWRTTITRPNGTELVIPASAVDPDEFAKIVRHYRAEAPRDHAQQVPGH